MLNPDVAAGDEGAIDGSLRSPFIWAFAADLWRWIDDMHRMIGTHGFLALASMLCGHP